MTTYRVTRTYRSEFCYELQADSAIEALATVVDDDGRMDAVTIDSYWETDDDSVGVAL